MTKTLTALAAFALMSGCTAIPAAAIFSGSLKGVERVSALYIADTRPNIDATAGSVCLINAMKRVEIVKLGSTDSRFLTEAYRTALAEVETRPKAANCLAALGGTAA